jgi:hypothetical protein
MTDPVVAVVTADRPSAVERCLLSLGRSRPAPAHVIVADNSATGGTEHACARVGGEMRIDYRGRDRRDTMARGLVTAGVDRELLAFAIDPPLAPAVGANRNALLLFTAGHRVVSLDDDVMVPLTAASRSSGLRLTGAHEPSVLDFPDHRDGFTTSLEPVVAGLHQAHMQLGSTVTDVVRAVASRGDPILIDDEVWREASARTSSETVRLTINGIEGGDGMGWPTRLLFLAGESRDNLLRDEETYRRAYLTCRIRRYVETTVITSHVSCMSTCLGLDNTRLLPPFFPAFRAADPLFGRVLGRCDPDAVVMFTPDVVQHFPIERRSRSRDDIWCRTDQRVTHLIGDLIDRVHLPGDLDIAERLVWLGCSLRGFAAGPWSDLRDAVAWLWQRRCAERLQQIARLRALHRRQPSYWDDDIAAHACRIEQGMRNPDAALPVEAMRPDDQNVAEGWCRLQCWLGSYGRLLQAWPDMWRLAKATTAT